MVKLLNVSGMKAELFMNNTHHRNLTPEALNLKNPLWQLKTDAFWSYSSYSVKRNAVYLMCSLPQHKSLKEFMVDGKKSKLPPLSSGNPKIATLNKE